MMIAFEDMAMNLVNQTDKKSDTHPKTLRALASEECQQVSGGMKMIIAQIKPFKAARYLGRHTGSRVPDTMEEGDGGL